jgi:hypothetical protein
MTYDEGKALLDLLLTKPCPACNGAAKVPSAEDPKHLVHCPARCVTGKVDNGLADALLEWLHDHLAEHFAEARHGHSFHGGE